MRSEMKRAAAARMEYRETEKGQQGNKEIQVVARNDSDG